MDRRSRTARKTLLGRIITGILKHLASMHEISVASKAYSPQQLAQFFQDELNTIHAVERLEAQRARARLDERRAYKTNRNVHAAFEKLVRGAFADARELADFGYAPEKAPKKALEVKQQALAKAKATREARGTMGKKQKKKIRG